MFSPQSSPFGGGWIFNLQINDKTEQVKNLSPLLYLKHMETPEV